MRSELQFLQPLTAADWKSVREARIVTSLVVKLLIFDRIELNIKLDRQIQNHLIHQQQIFTYFQNKIGVIAKKYNRLRILRSF